ncbi:MAG: penicillin-binding protein activator LpoB [Deltaproteobacteria bacterium RIFOXYA12_FULL_61_11]|nr:MAG: penicillin-binding protein activator LpoB [Deltaproteobacteria bacterium RIFOXYA12_FULL_61_11]
MVKLLVLLLMMSLLVSCGPKRTVQRTDVNTTIDLSGRWNDTDSRLVAEEMIRDCLQSAWIGNFKSQNSGKSPVLIVGRVANKSHEIINTDTFMNDLERVLVNSGTVEFVADSTQRQQLRSERADQLQHSRDDTVKGPGKEIGADYMVQGSIATIVDEAGEQKVVFYQVDLELIHVESNRKVWMLQKKIKKIVERASNSW